MRRSREAQVAFELVDPQVQHFDWTICSILIALLVFLPLAMGTHEMWNEAIAVSLAFAAAVALGAKLIVRTDQPFAWSWTYLPIAALLGYVAIQIVPLPAAVAGVLSPGAMADRVKLLADLPLELRSKSPTLSFYPLATWHDLTNLLGTVAVFIVTLNVVCQTPKMKGVLWAIAAIGTLEALLAIAQNLTGASGIYWAFPLQGGMRPEAGTFPNHNFFAQFVNLSSGAALALLLLAIDQTFHRHDYSPGEMGEKLASRGFRPAYLLIAMLAINAAAVFLSLSRGGILSLVIAGLFTAILLAIRGGRRGMGVAGWFAALVVVVIFALVMAGGSRLVEARISQVGNREDQFDRLRLSRNTLEMWKHYPLTGVGLGSFAYVFPRFDESTVEAMATHAEDEYVELLAELGVIGSAFLAIFLLMVGWAFFRARARGRRISEEMSDAEASESTGGAMERHSEGNARKGSRRRQTTSAASSLSMGIGFGLMAMLVQSVTDFAPHFLSVSCPAAVLAGLMCNLADLRQKERHSTEGDAVTPPTRVLRRRRVWRSGVMVIVLAIVSVFVSTAMRAWAGETRWNRSFEASRQLREAGWKNASGAAAEMDRYADEAVRTEPGNVLYRFWRAANHSRMIDSSLPDDQRRSAFATLAREMQIVCATCPTYGPAYCQLGQWQLNELNQPAEGARAIRISLWLAPNDSTTVFTAAGLAGDEGRWDESIALFRKAMKLDGGMSVDVMSALIDYYHRPELLIPLAENDIPTLRLAARQLRQHDGTADQPPPASQPATKEYERIARELEQRTDKEIERQGTALNPSPSALAEMGLLSIRRDNPRASLAYLQRALLYQPGRYDWRLAYAKALIAAKQDDDALTQLQILQRQQPGDTLVRELAEDIEVRRAMRLQQ